MSAFVRSKLKAARDAINKKDYEKARQSSLEVLEYEPDSFHANVFLGLAYLNLKETEKSEQAYRKAISLSHEQPLAWQGLVQLYEQLGDWTKYAESLDHLCKLFAKSGDATKCAETLQKLVDLRRDTNRSNRMQLAETLSLMLPSSPLYSVLSTLPPLDPTNPTSTTTHPTQMAIFSSLPILEELVSLYELEEDETAKREIEKRRTRLTAGKPEQIRMEVNREILSSSKLPNLYNEILNHPNTSDELRRSTESKLLRLKQRYLHVLPATGELAAQKAKVAAELEELINGMVLLEIRDELAWSLFIDSKDVETIEEYDFTILRRFVRLFPDSVTTKLIAGYFGYMGIPLAVGDEDEAQKQPIAEDEDFIGLIIDAVELLPESLFALRITVEMYHSEGDLENTIKMAESGLEATNHAETNSGKSLSQVKKAFDTALAAALVQYFPPKHHPRALKIIDEILMYDAGNVQCLMGKGSILQHSGKWSDASELYAKVVKLIPDDLEHGIRAKEEHAWCLAKFDGGKLEDAMTDLRAVATALDHLEDREEDKARCWWKVGKCLWDMGGDRREDAFRFWITSLQRSPTFAPTYTSLGVYYSDFLSPPDPNRASKCFQKAFELDPREAEAARRLAEGFAEEKEWDLVEVVARRTINGEGGLEGGAAPARYLPINAWAWKAVGAVELNRQDYPAAIQAFQIALRTDGEDQLSWLRLGEAYSKAGRFAAAVKALERARELNPEDWICSYFIGDVQRQTGNYQDAITAFEAILAKHPSELGVLLSLGQTYLDLGRSEVASAYRTRAEASFVFAIRVALQLIEASPGFRRIAWKIAADAVFRLSQFAAYGDENDVYGVLTSLVPLVSDHPGERLSGIITFPMSSSAPADIPLFALEIALSAYQFRITLDALNDTVLGSAKYDLGVALFSFCRRVPPGTKQDTARQEAVHQFKEALRLEPGNELYWSALGSATFQTAPRMAQHAFIKALDINAKNAITWTNLGLFYLHHGDAELANEAFYKAQTLDPDYALAWVGQGLVASANGHTPEARALFEHAVGLNAPVPEADVEFATRLFSRLNTTAQRWAATSDALFPAFFVLDRFCRERPQDASALHLLGLVCERVGHVELGVELITRAISLLEAAYEDTEDPLIERQFTIAHTNGARLRLSLQDYEGALESFQLVRGLLPEVPEDRTTRVLLAQAQFGAGLAHFKCGELAEALELFKLAMGTAAEDQVLRGHIIVLLSQTLWAIGTEEYRESAKSQLLQSIEDDPENLMAINTLAGMGILTDDDSLVDAALSEILELSVDQRLERDPGRDVPYLLVQHHLAQCDIAHALAVVQKAVLAEPSRPELRSQLAALDLRLGRSDGALAVLSGAFAALETNTTHLRGSLHLEAIARVLGDAKNTAAQEEARKLSQKAVMLTPWELRNWQALAFVQSVSVS
ncbi:hypothetical protein WOLCODRAFT_138620 [Wolfiporia cocos MD-104 SS10]|uniref:TPR-like protein n=1 Tax=Wolfiporia cocos (strain MD-104) TaxID=742152 RepID=A0A2H3JNT0_WOLCO|nr:hypothetical protein WOLCODRAFT_138620 [Wolfiporia cocos MD-104 SS10]